VCDSGSVVATSTPTPTATSIPVGPGCVNKMSNAGFEYSGDWVIANTSYPASYSSDQAYAGSRSMRTGIVNVSADRTSDSYVYQQVKIPSSAASVWLDLWFYPMVKTTVTGALAEPIPAFPADGKIVNAPLGGDVQYVLIRFADGTVQNVYWDRRDDRVWKNKSVEIKKHRGEYITVEFGTYNNAGGGNVTSMYVDELTLQTCSSSAPPLTPTFTPTGVITTTPPSGCPEKLKNTSFETNQGWEIPITAFSAGYSTAMPFTGVRSMRTGITAAAHNRYSYSDARQLVSIPHNATSALLSMYYYPKSGEAMNMALADRPTSTLFGTEALASDVQYLWIRSDSQIWKYKEFDLSNYAGETIAVQFGTYNDGYGGVTSMYVDDVSLKVCTP
jgi:hypothetical protein